MSLIIHTIERFIMVPLYNLLPVGVCHLEETETKNAQSEKQEINYRKTINKVRRTFNANLLVAGLILFESWPWERATFLNLLTPMWIQQL